MTAINLSIHLEKSNAHNDTRNIEIKLNKTYSTIYERFDELQKQI